MQRRNNRKSGKGLILAAAAVAGLAQVGYGASATWLASPTDSFWNNANWDNGGPYTPVAGDSLFFSTSGTTLLNNNFGSGTSFAGITFNSGASAFTLEGADIVLAAGSGITVNSGNSTNEIISFGINGGATTGISMSSATSVTGNNLTLNQNVTVGTLASSGKNTAAAALNTLTIASDKTLTVNGGITIGDGGVASLDASRSNLTITGATAGTGTVLAGAAGAGLQITNDGNTTNTNTIASLNLSGLGYFSFNGGATGSVVLSQGNRGVGSLTLASTGNVITVGTIQMSAGGGSNGGQGTINLGTGTNTINASVISLSTNKAGGTIQFANATNGTLKIRGTGGTDADRAAITVDGKSTQGTPSGQGALLLGTHTVDIKASSLNIVNISITGGSISTGTNGTVTFGDGTFDVNNLAIFTKTGAGTINTNGLATGTFSMTGGTLIVNNSFTMSNVSSSNTQAFSDFYVLGGTAQINSDITQSGALAANTIIQLDGGTLDMTGHAIGSGAASMTLNAMSGALKSVSQINGGATGLIKSGGNTLTLLGNNTYTGATAINSGTLAMAAGATLPNTSQINIQGGATFDVSALAGGYTFGANQTLAGNGSVVGTVNLGSATLSPGSSAGTLSISGNLNLLGGGTLAVELSNSAGGGNDFIAVGGNLNLSGTTKLKLTNLGGGYDTAPYTLMTYSSLSGAGNIQAPGAGLTTRQTFALNVGPTATTLTISGTPAANLTWTGDGTTNTWDHIATLWDNGGSPDKFFDLDSVTFNDSGSESPNINLTGALVPASVRIDSGGKDYVFSGTGSITTDLFTKDNGRTLTIANTGANNFASFVINSGTVVFVTGTTTATTFVNGGGALQVGAGTTSGSLPAGNLTNSGTVVFNHSDTYVLTSTIAGTGTTVIQSGTLQIGNGSGVGALSSGSIINNTALVLDRGADTTLTVTGGITGPGAVYKNGTGYVTLGGSGDYSGGTTISTGTLRVSSATGAGNGSVNVASGAAFSAIGNLTVANAINLTSATLGGNGSFTFTGDITASGASIIRLADPPNLPAAPTDASEVNITGNLKGNGNVTVLSNGQDNNPDSGNGFRLRGTGATDFSGVLTIGNNVKGELQATGNGPFSPAGTGKIVLAAGDASLGAALTTVTTTNGYSEFNLRNNSGGDTTFGNDMEIAGTGLAMLNPLGTAPNNALVNMGNLKLGNGQELGIYDASGNVHTITFSSVTLTGGTATFSPRTANFGAGTSVGGDLTLNNISQTAASNIVLASTFATQVSQQRTVTITGNNTYSGTTTNVAGSQVQLGNGATGASIASTALFTNNGTVVFNSSSPVTVAGSISGTGTVIHSGSGSSSVAGAISASGGVFINAGTLNAARFAGATLAVADGAKAAASVKGTANTAAGTSVVNALNLNNSGVLDLANNSIVIDYTSPIGTQLSDVQGHLRNGRLITSSATTTTRLGYGDNAVLGKTSFGGLPVDTSSVLIKYTYAGDADLDGDADGVDIGTWATNFTGELGGAGSAVWTQGDWDYDGDVDGVDAGLWAQAFTGELGGGGLGSLVVNDPTIAPGAAAILRGMGITVVPEPAAVGLLAAFGAVGMSCRRRRA